MMVKRYGIAGMKLRLADVAVMHSKKGDENRPQVRNMRVFTLQYGHTHYAKTKAA